MSAETRRGRILMQPDQQAIERARLSHYCAFLSRHWGSSFDDYAALHRWSVEHLDAFWSSVAQYFEVRFHSPPRSVLKQRTMPGATWFEGATLNYAEQALRWPGSEVAVIAHAERGERRELTFAELRTKVRACQRGLVRLGVTKADRVCAILPNGVEALVAFLACAGLGAIWSSCPPEFGAASVLERFTQIRPKVLLAVDAYTYGGQRFDRTSQLAQIRAALPELETLVLLHQASSPPVAHELTFEQLLQPEPGEPEGEPGEPELLPVAFDHPLWILYSSGTTGKPKAIVQSHGGILLEHVKALGLHQDLRPGERFFWYSTTGWMMWNYLVSGLLVGASVVLYDGSPTLEKLGVLWRLAEQEKLQHFGASAPYLMACRARGLEPGSTRDLSNLRYLGSTGAPLPDLGFEWVYEKVAPRVHLGSMSGGTDLCTAFVLSCPWLPVRAGELQCSALGADVQAFDESGQRVIGDVGELVILNPMPSMPLGFWGDTDGARYRASYFEKFPGVWRHGDWLLQYSDGAGVISGRSDATLNRGGVRMGTSEFYRALEGVAELEDSLVVERSIDGSSSELWLFVVLSPGSTLDEELSKRIKRLLAAELSPRHVPDVMCQLTRIPYTLSGKKLEVPVKRVLEGAALSSVAALDTLREPTALVDLEAAARPLMRRPRRS